MDILQLMGIKSNPIEGHRSYLMNLCPTRELDLLQDVTNAVKAFTVTLRPQHHGTNPAIIRKTFKDVTKAFVCKTRSGIYIRTHFEFTKNMVLHMHGYAVGKACTLGRLFSTYRRHFGYTLVKAPHALTKWKEYCDKENVYEMYEVFSYYKKK